MGEWVTDVNGDRVTDINGDYVWTSGERPAEPNDRPPPVFLTHGTGLAPRSTGLASRPRSIA